MAEHLPSEFDLPDIHHFYVRSPRYIIEFWCPSFLFLKLHNEQQQHPGVLMWRKMLLKITIHAQQTCSGYFKLILLVFFLHDGCTNNSNNITFTLLVLPFCTAIRVLHEHEPYTIHLVTTKDICQTTTSPLAISYPEGNTKKHTYITETHHLLHALTHTHTHLLCSHRH